MIKELLCRSQNEQRIQTILTYIYIYIYICVLNAMMPQHYVIYVTSAVYQNNIDFLPAVVHT